MRPSPRRSWRGGSPARPIGPAARHGTRRPRSIARSARRGCGPAPRSPRRRRELPAAARRSAPGRRLRPDGNRARPGQSPAWSSPCCFVRPVVSLHGRPVRRVRVSVRALCSRGAARTHGQPRRQLAPDDGHRCGRRGPASRTTGQAISLPDFRAVRPQRATASSASDIPCRPGPIRAPVPARRAVRGRQQARVPAGPDTTRAMTAPSAACLRPSVHTPRRSRQGCGKASRHGPRYVP